MLGREKDKPAAAATKATAEPRPKEAHLFVTATERKFIVSDDNLTPAQRLVGDFAPKLAELTDDVLFGDVWERSGLSKRDRSLVTVASLVTSGSTSSSSVICAGPRTTASPRMS